jgi:hypothetical protein
MHEHARDLERRTDALGEVLRVVVKKPDDATANSAATKERDSYGTRHDDITIHVEKFCSAA